MLIPVSLRNARYTRDKELVGLGKLDLTRQDSMLSVLSPSLSERMKSLDVTDTHQLDEDLKEVLSWTLEFANENGWLIYETLKVLEEKKQQSKGKLRDTVKDAIAHVTKLSKIATSKVSSARSSASPSPR